MSWCSWIELEEFEDQMTREREELEREMESKRAEWEEEKEAHEAEFQSFRRKTLQTGWNLRILFNPSILRTKRWVLFRLNAGIPYTFAQNHS
jgi:hypothetical protein